MELDYSRRRLSATSEERTIFYIDDMTAAQDSSPSSDVGPSPLEQPQQRVASSSRSGQQRRRNSSVSSQLQAGGNNAQASSGRPRRQRRPSEFAELQQQQHGSNLGRRSSNCHSAGRPRANSCARPTPLGDGRRASVCKAKAGGGGGTRRQSIVLQQRRDSARAAPRSEGGTRSPSVLLTPTSLEAELVKDPRELERARRHRRIAMILLGTFLFILAASVLAVVVTLTHSSFHKPPTGSKELAEHRANENEELLNSLNRDSSAPGNTTTSLPP